MVIERSAALCRTDYVPIKQSQSSLAHDLADRAVTALDEAREMPPGDERTETLHKATVLRNADEIQQLSRRQAKRAGRMTASSSPR